MVRKILYNIIPSGVLLLSMFLTNIVGNYATNREHRYNDKPLEDVLHIVFGTFNPFYLDIILIAANLLTIVILAYKSIRQRKVLYIHKMCFTIGIIYLLRCLCIYVTYLPNSRLCTFDGTNNLVTTIRKDFCGDLMFSGHTSQFAVGMIFLYELHPKKYIMYVGIVTSLLYAALISISRLHYTIDVIIALYTSLFVYQNVCMWYPYYERRMIPYESRTDRNMLSPYPIHNNFMYTNDHHTIVIQRTRARSQST